MTRVFLGVVAALLLHGLVTVARLEPVRTPRRVDPAVLARGGEPGAMTVLSSDHGFTVTHTRPSSPPARALRHEPDVLARAVAYGAPTVTLLLTALLCAWAFRTPRPREPSEPAPPPLRPESPYREAPLADLGPEATPAFDLLAARELRFSVLVGWGLALHALPAVTAALHLAR